MFILLPLIINISIIIIYFFIKLFFQIWNYCSYMLVSWFLLVHMWFTNDTMYVLTNSKKRLLASFPREFLDKFT